MQVHSITLASRPKINIFFPICFRSIGPFGINFYLKYFDFSLGDKQCNFPKMYKSTFNSPLCNIKFYKINTICTHRTFLPRRSFTVISIIACNFKKNITSIQPNVILRTLIQPIIFSIHVQSIEYIQIARMNLFFKMKSLLT